MQDTIELFGLSKAAPVSTPVLKSDLALTSKKAITSLLLDKEDTSTYRLIVGKLMYAMVATRPDLAFAVAFASRF